MRLKGDTMPKILIEPDHGCGAKTPQSELPHGIQFQEEITGDARNSSPGGTRIAGRCLVLGRAKGDLGYNDVPRRTQPASSYSPRAISTLVSPSSHFPVPSFRFLASSSRVSAPSAFPEAMPSLSFPSFFSLFPGRAAQSTART